MCSQTLSINCHYEQFYDPNLFERTSTMTFCCGWNLVVMGFPLWWGRPRRVISPDQVVVMKSHSRSEGHLLLLRKYLAGTGLVAFQRKISFITRL